MYNQQDPPIPKMYLAQIEGRCSLQYTAEDDDRQQWLKEWVDPKQDGQPYQHNENNFQLGVNGSKFCVRIKFPGRVFSNCGKDSILRPVLGKNGIPFIPGSSVKGLFKRVCNNEQKNQYCGNEEIPGKLRFHGAYPVGNWTGKSKVSVKENGQTVQKTCYLIEDLVHPQQNRQVEAEDITSASAFISFYQPTMIFEFSSADVADFVYDYYLLVIAQLLNNQYLRVLNFHFHTLIKQCQAINWQEVEQLLRQALSQGIGGKTSTGYGFAAPPDYAKSGSTLYQQALHISLEGTGVSSKLLSKKHEFRPNMFKAALRGHVCRLLAGIFNQEQLIKDKADELFGSTKAPGKVQIYWEQLGQPNYDTRGRKENNPTYSNRGVLHILSSPDDKDFINHVLQFAFIMGGFGKSWRRIAHELFHKEYIQQERKFDIGCHWKCFAPSDWVNVQSAEDLKSFLASLESLCCSYLNLNGSSVQPLVRWRESWHPDRVLVYSNVVSESKIVHLFHDERFKTVTAVGGRKIVNGKKVLVTSSVWHRMLPLPNNQYLEIVTVFHGDRIPWKRNNIDQLQPFIQEIKTKLDITTSTWGDESKL